MDENNKPNQLIENNNRSSKSVKFNENPHSKGVNTNQMRMESSIPQNVRIINHNFPNYSVVKRENRDDTQPEMKLSNEYEK